MERASLTSHHRVESFISIRHYDYWCWRDCENRVETIREGKKSSSQLCTHINSDDNKAMMGAFYVLKEKNHNKKEEQ